MGQDRTGSRRKPPTLGTGQDWWTMVSQVHAFGIDTTLGLAYDMDQQRSRQCWQIRRAESERTGKVMAVVAWFWRSAQGAPLAKRYPRRHLNKVWGSWSSGRNVHQAEGVAIANICAWEEARRLHSLWGQSSLKDRKESCKKRACPSSQHQDKKAYWRHGMVLDFIPPGMGNHGEEGLKI